jgi:tRNA(Ile)-lysidine synthase
MGTGDGKVESVIAVAGMKPSKARSASISSSIKDGLRASFRKYSMLAGGETVLVGLSGGPDSVCLLRLLHMLREEFNLKLHAVYVDHNLRPDETPDEIKFCQDLCKKIDVGFTVRSLDVVSYAKERRLNKQEAARELRYRAFDETAFEIGADRVALAHNADDQVETLFMRLIRGSGPKGLSGIPPKRGKIIRPLIETKRRFIEDFLDAEKIPFVVDSSNLRPDYFRNKLRQSLIPMLREMNPNLTETITNTMSIIQEEDRYFEIIVTKTLMRLISRKTTERIELFMMPMEIVDTVILRRVLRRAIAETQGLRGISFAHIEDIINLIKHGRSGARLYLPKGIRVIKEYSLLIMTSEKPVKVSSCELNPPAKLPIRESGVVIDATFAEKGIDGVTEKSSVLLDAGLMRFPLLVRSRRPGDFFFPAGFGRKKKLQDFFVDEKVPRDERDKVPIIVSGDDIVWIAGYRADERFRVTQHTQKILRLVIVKGNF